MRENAGAGTSKEHATPEPSVKKCRRDKFSTLTPLSLNLLEKASLFKAEKQPNLFKKIL
jgi:hypothetical protein